MTAFRRHLGRVFKGKEAGGLAVGDAAVAALDGVCEELSKPTSRWLGLLPVPAGAALPANMFTHLPVRDLNRYVASGPINEANPPRNVTLARPFKFTATGVRSRFIWVTFNPDGAPPSDDPTQVVKELGLAHLLGFRYLYRFWLRTDGTQLYIPSCLDARLNEAWAPPPAGNAQPWGLTRDLETGHSCKPELLTETVAHETTLPTATLVSPAGWHAPIGNVATDFMANR